MLNLSHLSRNEKIQLINHIYKKCPSKWVEDLGLIRDKQNNPIKLDPWQIEMLDTDKTRICLNIHRQGGKSSISSALLFHKALFYPKSLGLIVAPSLRQSGENFRKIMDSLENLEPRPELVEGTRLTLKFENGSRIVSLPGTQRTIRGFSAQDVIIVDEAAQIDDELITALMPMMITYPQCKWVLCSTPFGQLGYFYRVWHEGGPEWKKIKLTAVDNPRIPKESIDEARNDGTRGPMAFQQEFLCEFVANNTQLIDMDTIKKAQNLDVPIIKFGV